MTDQSIFPDESSGVPVCRRLCPQYRHLVGGHVGCNLSIYCVDPGETICLPRVRKMGEEIAELRRQLDEISRLDTPWPLHEVLSRLVHAADHLLRDHGCDTHGHEGIRDAAAAGRAILTGLARWESKA